MKYIPAIVIFFSALLMSCNNKGESTTKLSKSERKEVMENKTNRVSPPITASATISENTVTINYGSPRVKGRVIWGGLVPLDTVWRTGANEATTLEITKDIFIEGEPLKKDKYAVFTIPSEKEWTIIFNTESKQWGAFKYDASKDALRLKVVPETTDTVVENLTFTVLSDPQKTNAGIIRFEWDKLKFDLHFENAPNE